MESLPSGGTEATVYVSSYHSHSLARISPEGHVQVAWLHPMHAHPCASS